MIHRTVSIERDLCYSFTVFLAKVATDGKTSSEVGKVSEVLIRLGER